METQGKVISSFENLVLVKMKQGDTLPTVFFNLDTEKYIRNVETGPGGREL